MDAATAAGVRVGCAPDTVLGTGHPDGARGHRRRPDRAPDRRARPSMVTPGHERWHPNPDFYYLAGGGPLLDMGPYYVGVAGPPARPGARGRLARPAAAARARHRLRPARRASGSRSRWTRHVTGVLEHAGGALSTITTSFDGVATTAAPIEVHGETGTLAVPDPNHFEGETRLFELGGTEWRALEPSAGYVGAGRGIGLVDLVTSEGRASGDLALHVLEVMTALLDSAAEGRRIALTTTMERPRSCP